MTSSKTSAWWHQLCTIWKLFIYSYLISVWHLSYWITQIHEIMHRQVHYRIWAWWLLHLSEISMSHITDRIRKKKNASRSEKQSSKVPVNFFRNCYKFVQNLTFNLRFKYTDRLFYYIIIPLFLVSRYLPFLRFSYPLVVFLYLGP